MCPLLPVLSERETRTARLSDRHIRDFLRYLIHRPKQPFNRCSAGENSTHTHTERTFFLFSLIDPATTHYCQSSPEHQREWGQTSLDAKKQWAVRVPNHNGKQDQLSTTTPPLHYTFKWHYTYNRHMAKPHHCIFMPPNQHSITPLQTITSLLNRWEITDTYHILQYEQDSTRATEFPQQMVDMTQAKTLLMCGICECTVPLFWDFILNVSFTIHISLVLYA